MTQTRGPFDVLVIGAGGCGMVAALVAAQHGARVALIEKTDKPGGGTAFSSRGLRAAGTRFQQTQSVEDSGEQYARDIRERNSGQSDPELTLRLARSTSEVVHGLADTAGIEFEVPEFMFGHSARRSHSWRADRKITDYLFDAVQRETNIETFFSVAASSFVLDAGGAVTGVATDKRDFNARKTILATGGFGASPELVAKYIPKAAGIPFPGHHGSTGDGLHMALDLGAVPAHMDAFQPYPAYLGPGKRSVTPEVIMSGGIMVGPDGRRFGNETRYPGGLSAGILNLPDKQGYEVFDQRIFDLQRHQLGDVESDFVKADTAAQLAEKLGIGAAGLEETLGSFNAALGTNDEFGRQVTTALAPPLYGVKVTVALYHTQGGIRVSPEGEVLRKDGSPIPNLYAGGGVAAGVSGDGMEGYLPGNGQLASLGLGFIAGKNAALSLGERTAPR